MKKVIFEKAVGKNTGLGLFLLKSIFSITGLNIDESGIEGKGARFVITIRTEAGDQVFRKNIYQNL